MNLTGSVSSGAGRFSVLILVLALFTILAGSGYRQPGMAVEGSSSLLERLETTDSGVVETGELVYINDGKKLGNETYEIRKEDDGGLVLNSEGVVTPPIPIPFVKPRIKFNQTVEIDNNLEPVFLSLQYKGPLGIGSKKITASVNGDTLELNRGKDSQTISLDSEQYYFSGTTSSGALFAIVLARQGKITRLTEIRSGGTGPGGGDDDEALARVEFVSKEEFTMKINGREETVTGYKYWEDESGRERELIIKDGSLVAYRAKAGDSSFYAYRKDMLGEEFRF